MKILSIDTTQEFCSAALLCGEKLIYREELAPRDHTRLILPQVDSLMAEAGLTLAELDALAFGRGPGSFTGLRIAAGVIQGLAFGADLPVAPVSSLVGLAQGVYRESPGTTRVCAAFDARINEVYWGCYALKEGVMTPINDEQISVPDDVHLPTEDTNWIAAGSAWDAYPQLTDRLTPQLGGVSLNHAPLARDLIPIAITMVTRDMVVPATHALPVYLRNKVAQTIEERGRRGEIS